MIAMTRRPQHRFPLQPLLDKIGAPTDHDARAILRISGQRLEELRVVGLTDEQADRYAIRVGLWPSSVWSDWYAHAPSELDLYEAAMHAAATRRRACPRRSSS